jgi:L-rhamnose isomerase
VQHTIRTFVEIPSKGFQGSEGSPRTATIKTTVEGAIDSMAQSEPCVGSDVPQDKFMTKEEFKTFASNLFTKLEGLNSSILAPVLEPQANPFTEALKANTEALNALKAEVAVLKASAVTKDELKKTLTAIKGQSSAIQQIKADIISEAGKYVSDVATA